MTIQTGITDQPILKTTSYGGGGSPFCCTFGRYITCIDMYTWDTALRGLDVTFSDGTKVRLGSNGDLSATVLLVSDSIANMYIQVKDDQAAFPGGGKGVVGLYIETIQGKIYQAGGYRTPVSNPTGWTLVTTDGTTPAKNMILVGLSVVAGDSIDDLAFLYKNDILVSRVVDNFDYSNLASTDPTPINVASATVHNQTSENQQMSVTFEKSVTSSYTWGVEAGISIGVEASFKTGIPFVAEGQVTVSTELSFSASFGEEHTTSETFSYTAEVSVPSNTAIKAKASATTSIVSGKYTANFIKNWAHAGAIIQPISGTINGLTAYDVEVDYIPVAFANLKK
jgi:hypothetical protein